MDKETFERAVKVVCFHCSHNPTQDPSWCRVSCTARRSLGIALGFTDTKDPAEDELDSQETE